jgi:hypothetical protein
MTRSRRMCHRRFGRHSCVLDSLTSGPVHSGLLPALPVLTAAVPELTNGVTEELIRDAVPAAVLPDDLVCGWLWSAVGFTAWHVVPPAHTGGQRNRSGSQHRCWKPHSEEEARSNPRTTMLGRFATATP